MGLENRNMARRHRTRKIEYAVNIPQVYEWAVQIGKLMINYSALELEIDRWLIHLSERVYTDAHITKERSRGFQQKHKEVMKLARRRSPSDEWLGKAVERLKRAKEIADVRDQVAHAPLFSLLNEPHNRGLESSRIPPTPRQRQAGRVAHLEYKGLQTAVDDAVVVVQDLGNLLQQWRNAYKAGSVQLDPATLSFPRRIMRIGIHWWLRIRGT